jgi:hypothetical protein
MNILGLFLIYLLKAQSALSRMADLSRKWDIVSENGFISQRTMFLGLLCVSVYRIIWYLLSLTLISRFRNLTRAGSGLLS